MGNHKELISKDGIYKRIWDIQNSLDAFSEDEEEALNE